ncbi:M3 family oligoendopeptidase [Sedimentibacter sp. zth1]|uniref:M3 family oligoendopeptidase n=1 Tax=Sedimentibacter sp. zth1 TaxID=2816908 RepID=UPI001A91BE18|nr:M3 family oligoendopeptidase [Sedimentibacter sp. zth1]QSX06421.1 M3 family oligoendopeptidase [Sedimentibacter sp. zth1]
MDNTWSLKELYDGFNCKEFKNDLDELSRGYNVMQDFVTNNFYNYENTTSKIEKYLDYYIKYSEIAAKLRGFAFLSLATDSKNSDASANLSKIGDLVSSLTESRIAFQNYIINYDDLSKSIEESSILKEHEFYLNEIVEASQHQLSDKEEILISKMKLTGSSAWSQLQGKVSSQAMVELEENGQKTCIPITALSQLPSTEDKKVKINRFKAECKAYDKYADISAACLNSIKGEVITIANLRGYQSPIDMTLNDCRMDRETLDALIGSIEEYLPKLRKYYKVKAKLLKYDNGLPYFDITANVGNSNKKYSIEEAKGTVLKAFRGFSEELYLFAKNAFDNRWVDFEPRQGKRSGAFCSGVYPIKQSRVLTNFNGGIKDVNTIAHELGHGFHGKQLSTESILNNSYPMPLAETASTFCEQVLKGELVKEISKEEKLSFLSFSILSAVAVTVDILSRYYFETEFFERRKDHTLSVEEIKEIMIDAQKKSYGDGLDSKYLNPYMWLNKVHYYYAERNFYNFPYAFGLLFSLGLHSIYEKKGEAFLTEYNNLLKATGKMKIADVCKLVGVDVRSKDFWRMSLDKIVKSIDEFEKLANEYKC